MRKTRRLKRGRTIKRRKSLRHGRTLRRGGANATLNPLINTAEVNATKVSETKVSEAAVNPMDDKRQVICVEGKNLTSTTRPKSNATQSNAPRRSIQL